MPSFCECIGLWGGRHTVPLVLLLSGGDYLLLCLTILFLNILIKILELIVYHYLILKKINRISDFKCRCLRVKRTIRLSYCFKQSSPAVYSWAVFLVPFYLFSYLENCLLMCRAHFSLFFGRASSSGSLRQSHSSVFNPLFTNCECF